MSYAFNLFEVVVAENNTVYISNVDYINNPEQPILFDEPIAKVYTKSTLWQCSYFAQTTSGRLFAWGDNTHGQLGLNRTESLIGSPQEVILPNHAKVAQVVLGVEYSAVLTDKGEVYVCGSNNYGQLGLANQVINLIQFQKLDLSHLTHKPIAQLAAGAYHMLALSQDQKLIAWGNNRSGQLGQKKSQVHLTNAKVMPQKVKLPYSVGAITHIAAGIHHSMFLTEQGTVFCSGSNLVGQLGFGENISGSNDFEFLKALKNEHIIGITTIDNYCMVWSDKGNCFYWGLSDSQEIFTPQKYDGNVLKAICRADGLSIVLAKQNDHYFFDYLGENATSHLFDKHIEMKVIFERAFLNDYHQQILEVPKSSASTTFKYRKFADVTLFTSVDESNIGQAELYSSHTSSHRKL